MDFWATEYFKTAAITAADPAVTQDAWREFLMRALGTTAGAALGYGTGEAVEEMSPGREFGNVPTMLGAGAGLAAGSIIHDRSKAAASLADVARDRRRQQAEINATEGLHLGASDLLEQAGTRHAKGTALGLLAGVPLGALAGGYLGDSPEAALGGGLAGMAGGALAGNGLSRIGDQRRFENGVSAILSRAIDADEAYGRYPLAMRFGSPETLGDRDSWKAMRASGPLDSQQVEPISMEQYHATPHVAGGGFIDYIAGRRASLPQDDEVLDVPEARNNTTLGFVPQSHLSR